LTRGEEDEDEEEEEGKGEYGGAWSEEKPKEDCESRRRGRRMVGRAGEMRGESRREWSVAGTAHRRNSI
jgi:hypothetical protein